MLELRNIYDLASEGIELAGKDETIKTLFQCIQAETISLAYKPPNPGWQARGHKRKSQMDISYRKDPTAATSSQTLAIEIMAAQLEKNSR